MPWLGVGVGEWEGEGWMKETRDYSDIYGKIEDIQCSARCRKLLEEFIILYIKEREKKKEKATYAD